VPVGTTKAEYIMYTYIKYLYDKTLKGSHISCDKRKVHVYLLCICLL